MEYGEGGRTGCDWVSLFLLLLEKNLHARHRSSDVTPWVIYKRLIMRLFLPFSLSIHPARCGGLCLVWMGLWDRTKYLERDAANGRNKVVVLDSTVNWKGSNCVDDWVVTGRGWKNWLHSLANLLGELFLMSFCCLECSLLILKSLFLLFQQQSLEYCYFWPTALFTDLFSSCHLVWN